MVCLEPPQAYRKIADKCPRIVKGLLSLRDTCAMERDHILDADYILNLRGYLRYLRPKQMNTP